MTTTATTTTTNSPDLARVQAALDELLAAHDPATTDPATFCGFQFDAGLAWVHFDEGDGGLGVSPSLQSVVNRAIARAGGTVEPLVTNPIGYGMAAPTIATHGSEVQRRAYLRRIFTAEDVWCQLFSEPGAGSDVGGLSTRAVRDGDEWIVNGQKVWTSLAHLARYGLLLARTDPGAPKHAGLSYFVVDMHGPGVEVRPLRQITGHAEFNEVYFTDARVPDSERLGPVGDGWKVAITTLMNERAAIGGSPPPRGAGTIRFALDAWAARGTGPDDAVRRDALMALWIRAETLRLTGLRAGTNARRGTPGPEASVMKLAYTELNKAIMSLTMDLLGAEATLYGDYAMPDSTRLVYSKDVDARRIFLRYQANTIEGGTSEIMRNILGERVLGLPREPRADTGPWVDIPRN